MTSDNKEIAKLSPEKLMASFVKTKLMVWVGVALLLHAIVIGALSVSYIRDRWIDPEGAVARKAQAEAQKKAAIEAAKPKPPPPAPAATNAAPAAAVTNSATADAAATTGVVAKAGVALDADSKLIEQRKNTPVVKRITELPKPGEKPGEPGDLGIGLDETNPK